jgi:drug/metabolite transporter (DMT)-like permease
MHLAVLAYGFTAIFGALLQIDPISLVWWRILITLGTLLVIYNPGKKLFLLSRSEYKQLALSGLVITLHWICFYTSIKWANASIAVVALATMPFFTAILNPLMTHTAFDKLQIITGLVVVPGMALLFNVTDITMWPGLWMGILAAFLSSLFTIMNKKLLQVVPIRPLIFIQLAAGFIFLSICMPVLYQWGLVYNFKPVGHDWIWIFSLAIFCTALAFIVASKALKVLSPFVVNLTVNLEPIYAVFLAIIILKENKELDFGFYIGMVIILGSVFLYPMLNKSKPRLI